MFLTCIHFLLNYLFHDHPPDNSETMHPGSQFVALQSHKGSFPTLVLSLLWRSVVLLPAASPAMADANFLELARGFGELLPAEERPFWRQILSYHEQGIYSQQRVLENMRALQNKMGAGTPSPGAPGPADAHAGQTQGEGIPQAWQQPPEAIYHPSMGAAHVQPGYPWFGMPAAACPKHPGLKKINRFCFFQ